MICEICGRHLDPELNKVYETKMFFEEVGDLSTGKEYLKVFVCCDSCRLSIKDILRILVY